MIELLNIDCMTFMATLKDKAFDLAIVDPPYGIGEKFKGGKTGKMQFNEIVDKQWDIAPTSFYFDELFRVSMNQIIWGGNYFQLPPTRGMIVWDKLISEDFSLAMVELAWTSFDRLAKLFRRATPKTGGKIHPTQKPVALYDWILRNYAKPGQRILDTHLGSGSSAIAAHYFGCDFVGCEIDVDYFNAAKERFDRETRQVAMF
jgi:site-specific DNA-methyltransferase (adenine-specific)